MYVVQVLILEIIGTIDDNVLISGVRIIYIVVYSDVEVSLTKVLQP